METDFTNEDPSLFDRASRQDGVLGIGSDPKAWLPGHDKVTEVFGSPMKDPTKNMPPFAFPVKEVAACEEVFRGLAA